jgi:hypothetical protein
MSNFQVSDPYFVLPTTRVRQQEDARRAAEWRLARDLAKSQRAARRAGQPVRDELVQAPSVPVGRVLKIWWHNALRSLRPAG